MMISKVDILKKRILDDIRQGRLKPDDALYSRHQFMKRFGCSRGSIDTAVKELIAEGYLYGRQGAGTYVANLRPLGTEISRVFVVENFCKSYTADDLTYTSYLVSEIQRRMPCLLYRADEISVNLRHIVRAGSAVIWVRPSLDKMMLIDYLTSARIPQIIIGRRYGNYDYIDTDSRSGLADGLSWLKQHAGPEIAFVARAYNTNFPYIAERQIDFYETCTDLRLTVKPNWRQVSKFDHPEDDLNAVAEALFGGSCCPRGLYVDYCDIVAKLINLAGRRGKFVGRDFFLLAFDRIPELENVPGAGFLAQQFRGLEDCAVSWVTSSDRLGWKKTLKPNFYHWE